MKTTEHEIHILNNNVKDYDINLMILKIRSRLIPMKMGNNMAASLLLCCLNYAPITQETYRAREAKAVAAESDCNRKTASRAGACARHPRSFGFATQAKVTHPNRYRCAKAGLVRVILIGSQRSAF